ncbi:MAG: outer membrane protein assembly factor, partial [Flavobacteriaceae bacterium]|nr:outer membrane protein assembly factor [Flavobacteriaceae bacterium]
MKRLPAKLSLFILTLALFFSCNAVKRVGNDELLLSKNIIYLNGKKNKESRIHNQLYQEPNSKLLGIPLSLHFYNLAKPQPDTAFQHWLYKKPNRKERLIKIYSEKQVVQMGNSYVALNEWIK